MHWFQIGDLQYASTYSKNKPYSKILLSKTKTKLYTTILAEEFKIKVRLIGYFK